jgi:rSAM/selenodomain-associated transferase 2
VLSIIVPCLNEADGITDALSALAPLRARGAEVIVVDGGSHDDTVARAAPRADLVITSQRGRAMQMNAGAGRARGEILLFLHADTLLPEAADALVVEGLQRTRRGWGRFDVTIASRHPLLGMVARLMNLRSRLTGIATGDQAIFVRRDAFPGFPEIALMEDVAFSRAMRRGGRPACLASRATTSGRRWESRGVLRTILLMWRLRLLYFLGARPERLARLYRR